MVINKLRPYIIQQRVLVVTYSNNFFHRNGFFNRPQTSLWSDWRKFTDFSDEAFKSGIPKKVLDNLNKFKDNLEDKVEYRLIKG